MIEVLGAVEMLWWVIPRAKTASQIRRTVFALGTPVSNAILFCYLKFPPPGLCPSNTSTGGERKSLADQGLNVPSLFGQAQG